MNLFGKETNMNHQSASNYVFKEAKLSMEQKAVGQLLYCLISHITLPVSIEAQLDDIETNDLPEPLNLIVAMFQRANSLYAGMEAIEASLPTILGDAIKADRKKNRNGAIYEHVKSLPEKVEQEYFQTNPSTPLPKINQPCLPVLAGEGLTEKEIDGMTDEQINQWVDKMGVS
jgi:hypothetical protein